MACYGLDTEWLKRTFLFGVDLTDDDQNPYPSELFDLAIDAAIEIVEAETGIWIKQRVVTNEMHDLVAGDWLRDYQFEVIGSPLKSVQRILFQHGDFASIEIPSNWIHIRDEDTGLIDIIRGQGSFVFRGGPLWAESGLSPTFLGWSVNTRLPGHLRVSYTAGFLPGRQLPALVKLCVGHIAAMLPLDTAGDLIVGAGIASYSKSMDGISESVSTTSSATNAGYGARILSYQKQLERNMSALRSQYRGVQAMVI